MSENLRFVLHHLSEAMCQKRPADLTVATWMTEVEQVLALMHRHLESQQQLPPAERETPLPSSSEDTATLEATRRTLLTSFSTSSRVSPDGNLPWSVQEAIVGWLNSQIEVGELPANMPVEITVTISGTTPTSRDTGLRSGSASPSTGEQSPGRSGPAGEAGAASPSSFLDWSSEALSAGPGRALPPKQEKE